MNPSLSSPSAPAANNGHRAVGAAKRPLPLGAPPASPATAPSAHGPTIAMAASPLRVCILYAYPSLTRGHGPKILQTVLDTLRETGHPYDLIDLYRERFNPVMSEEEEAQYGASLWPDVQGQQAKLSAAGTWIFLYPVWWSTPPAILKGWLDRVLAPNFAFRYDAKGMHPLLEGKRALIVRTFGSSAAVEAKAGHVAQAFMDRAVLDACGVKSSAVEIYSADRLAESAFGHALFGVSGAVRRLLVSPSGVPHRLRSIAAPYLPPIEPRLRLPLEEGGDEKPKLSESAKADLEYFKSARRQAREAVHRRADARQSGGKPGQKKEGRGFFGSGRGGSERGSFAGGKSEGGSFGSGGGQSARPFGSGKSERGFFGGGRNVHGGGQFFGRKPQAGQNQGQPNRGQPRQNQGGQNQNFGRRGKRRRR